MHVTMVLPQYILVHTYRFIGEKITNCLENLGLPSMRIMLIINFLEKLRSAIM